MCHKLKSLKWMSLFRDFCNILYCTVCLFPVCVREYECGVLCCFCCVRRCVLFIFCWLLFTFDRKIFMIFSGFSVPLPSLFCIYHHMWCLLFSSSFLIVCSIYFPFEIPLIHTIWCWRLTLVQQLHMTAALMNLSVYWTIFPYVQM